MPITLLPDVGDLARLYPAYNAATIVELARVVGARRIVSATPPDPEHPVLEAFDAAGMPVVNVAPDWSWANPEHAQLLDFLNQYPQGRERLREAAALRPALQDVLAVPLTAQRVTNAAFLAQVKAYHDGMREALGEGPGTLHRQQRLAVVTEGITREAAGDDTVALVALDDVPDILEALPEARLPDVSTFQPGEPSRLRALVDRALRLEDNDDLEGLVTALLRERGDAITPRAELQYAAANVYLAVGDLTSARGLLEDAAHALTDRPRSLPALVLARLGQVRDAQGDRDLARRTYQAVLALPWAPQVALDAAQRGQQEPFLLEN